MRRPIVLRAAFLATPLVAASAPHPEFKVVTWFDRARPIATFQYQVYDVRKGDYTPAVDAWVDMMRAKFPGYEVAVRDVDLARESGPTERRKVGAVVQRELLAAAAAEGVFLTPGGSARGAVASAPMPTSAGPMVPLNGLNGPLPYLPAVPMTFRQNPSPSGFPVPMPYPRPHP